MRGCVSAVLVEICKGEDARGGVAYFMVAKKHESLVGNNHSYEFP